ncbi:MAG: protein kinase [Proteobacteria bacterium]|nr:protein kinase [Pseudomonadota bacterium]
MTAKLDSLPVQFGRYEVQRLVGEGGMGRVFEARLVGPAGFIKTVALKVLRASVDDDEPRVREGIFREARVGGLLKRPNIVDVYDFGIEDGQPWVAMELVRGEGLDARLAREGAVAPHDALRIAIEIARGLQAVHELQVDSAPAGLVHRDLKPANVLLGTHGEVKISDFGLARADEGEGLTSQATTSLRGTPAYMSPEQANGDELDGRSDLFALGAILFEMLSGERLLRGGTVMEQMMALVRVSERIAELPDRFGHTTGLAELLAGCLQEEAERRFEDADAFCTAARSVLYAIEWSATEEVEEFHDVTTVAIAPLEDPTAEALVREGPETFVGRETDLEALDEFVQAGGRLVTLVGPGGTGKTRLAQRFAVSRSARFAGGSWWFDLSEATSADGVCAAAARALGIGLTSGESSERVAAAIAGRGRCLIVVDNLEQVQPFATKTLALWTERCPEATFVVTSRVVLQLSEEFVYRLGPLETPIMNQLVMADDLVAAVEGNPAVQLFVQRAKAARSTFDLTESNVQDVAMLVFELDGIPLAIELAAARTKVLSPARILERLPRRFDLLTTGRQDVTGRQATLRATIDWSWNLLEPWEQAALAQCSVFRGGFDLEAAEAVIQLEGAWAVDALQALQDKILLRSWEPPETPGGSALRHLPVHPRIRRREARRRGRVQPGRWELRKRS